MSDDEGAWVATALHRQLDDITAPAADPRTIIGRTRSRRRSRAIIAAAAGVAAAVGIGATVVGATWGDRDLSGEPGAEFSRPRSLETSDGLRAFASPGARLWYGGTSLSLAPGHPGSDLPYLDTDAAATRFGVVTYDGQGVPVLVDGAGWHVLPSRGAVARGDHLPGVAVDGTGTVVAYAAVTEDGSLALSVYDLERRQLLGGSDVYDCGQIECDTFEIDGLSDGWLFKRFAVDPDYSVEGSGAEVETTASRISSTEGRLVAHGGTRIADVRSRTILYAGPAPVAAPPGRWTLVQGPVDARLTSDGRYVVGWSRTLQPTDPADEPVRLRAPGARFFSVDTDGSVLAATLGDPSTVYDCAVPSGRCEVIEEVPMVHGDPLFPGDDE